MKKKNFRSIFNTLIKKKNFFFFVGKTFFFWWAGPLVFRANEKKNFSNKKKIFVLDQLVRNCSKASFFSNYSRSLQSQIFGEKICDRPFFLLGSFSVFSLHNIVCLSFIFGWCWGSFVLYTLFTSYRLSFF